MKIAITLKETFFRTESQIVDPSPPRLPPPTTAENSVELKKTKTPPQVDSVHA